MIGIMFAAAISAQGVENCKAIEELAYMASLANQKGVPATRIMEIAGNDELHQAIALDVISMPRYSTDERQIKESRDYATTIAAACLKGLKK